MELRAFGALSGILLRAFPALRHEPAPTNGGVPFVEHRLKARRRGHARKRVKMSLDNRREFDNFRAGILIPGGDTEDRRAA
jgi:hypothetical protein